MYYINVLGIVAGATVVGATMGQLALVGTDEVPYYQVFMTVGAGTLVGNLIGLALNRRP